MECIGFSEKEGKLELGGERKNHVLAVYCRNLLNVPGKQY